MYQFTYDDVVLRSPRVLRTLMDVFGTTAA